jgi:hypothetical protein
MTKALAGGIAEVGGAPAQALAQVERAIAATLEYHANLRLMPAAASFA